MYRVSQPKAIQGIDPTMPCAAWAGPPLQCTAAIRHGLQHAVHRACLVPTHTCCTRCCRTKLLMHAQGC